jgi:AraC-like DNA-binding protein
MAEKRKLNIFDWPKKKGIIDYVDSHKHLKIKDIASSFRIPPSTLSTIIKDKEKINEQCITAMNLKAKKLRLATNENADKCLLEWFRQVSKVRTV